MPKRNVNFNSAPEAVARAVAEVGRNIAIARVRRRLREEDLAAKAGISRLTLRRVEAGALGTGIGAYVAVLWALGLDGDIANLASPSRDAEGQTLEAAHRGERVRLGKGLNDEF